MNQTVRGEGERVGGRGQREGRGPEEPGREIREMPQAHSPAPWTRWCHYTFHCGISHREGKGETEREGRVEKRLREKVRRKPRHRVKEGEREREIWIVQQRERERGGEKLDTDNLRRNFFSSFLSPWKKPQATKKKKKKKSRRPKKKPYTGLHFICIATQKLSQSGPWIHTRFY